MPMQSTPHRPATPPHGRDRTLRLVNGGDQRVREAPISPLAGEMSAGRGGRASVALSMLLLALLFALMPSPPPPPPRKSTTSSAPGSKPTSGPKPRQAASRKATFDAAFAGVTPNLEAARSGHARRKAEDAEEAASGRVRLARQLFRREDHRRGQRRRARPRRQACAGRSPRSRSATACRASIVLAIWGRESGFGAAKIPYDAFEVLGTKAFLADPQGDVPQGSDRGARHASSRARHRARR